MDPNVDRTGTDPMSNDQLLLTDIIHGITLEEFKSIKYNLVKG